jgi:uncharacterized protein
VKVVLDSNVLLAAFTSRGLCEAVAEVCLHSHQLCLSQYILEEVETKLIEKFKMPAAHAGEIARFLRRQAIMVRPQAIADDACADRDDLPILGTALAARADCLVSGDRDLLRLKEFNGIAVLSPRAFHDRLR